MYVVRCTDQDTSYGPFDCDEGANRYAALLDIDPACRDRKHEVDWASGMKTPETYDDLLTAVTERIRQRAQSGKPLCPACGDTVPLPNSRYCSAYCEPARTPVDNSSP